ncbi:MAG: cytochrome c oxidase assembly protein [Bacteroidota bacterium]
MQFLLIHWHFDFIITACVLILVLQYLYTADQIFCKKAACFVSGMLLVIICTSLPMSFPGSHYVLSTHMLAHTLLLLVAAPLLVLGWQLKTGVPNILLNISQKTHRFPLVCWLSGVLTMWVWHIPALYNLMANQMTMNDTVINTGWLSYLHLISMLLAGIFFCLPIITPLKRFRIAAPNALIYLSSACVFCSILGLLITFAPVNLYTGYMNDMTRSMAGMGNDWKVWAKTDQEVAGLIMWVPCCFIYLAASMVILVKWLAEKKVVHYQQSLKM